MEKIISLIGKLCKEEMSIKSVQKKARFNLGLRLKNSEPETRLKLCAITGRIFISFSIKSKQRLTHQYVAGPLHSDCQRQKSYLNYNQNAITLRRFMVEDGEVGGTFGNDGGLKLVRLHQQEP